MNSNRYTLAHWQQQHNVDYVKMNEITSKIYWFNFLSTRNKFTHKNGLMVNFFFSLIKWNVHSSALPSIFWELMMMVMILIGLKMILIFCQSTVQLQQRVQIPGESVCVCVCECKCAFLILLSFSQIVLLNVIFSLFCF